MTPMSLRPQLWVQSKIGPPDPLHVMLDYPHGRHWLGKPWRVGFWTSTYTPGCAHPSRWVDWCYGEMPGWTEGKPTWLLTAKLHVRIYEITGQTTLVALWRRFPDSTALGYTGVHTIDWKKVAEEYDAVHLTERGHWRTRWGATETELNTYAWDCESTWWPRWCFEDVQPGPTIAVAEREEVEIS